jgi:hypothetical protein
MEKLWMPRDVIKMKRIPTHIATACTTWLGRSVCLLGVIVATGCQQSDLAEVSGRVMLDGKPLREGFVTFYPAADTAGPEFSGEIVAGEYRVAKPVLPGNYLVQIRSWQKTGRKVKSPIGDETEEIINIIPKRYRTPSSELSTVLASGPNSANFDLKK